MDELNEKVDLIKKKIEDAKKAGDAGYAKSLESYLNVTQSSLNSIQGWYSSLNEIFGIIGFGIAVGIYSVYLSEKFVVSLLMSIGAFIILLFKSAEVGRRLPLFKRGGRESKDDAKARKFFKDVVMGSPRSLRYWWSTMPYFIGIAAIFFVGVISFFSLRSAFLDGGAIWERSINPLVSIKSDTVSQNTNRTQMVSHKCNVNVIQHK